MSGRFVDVEGGRLWVVEEGRGAPVLLLHGFTLDGRMWDDVAPALAARFRVIRLDQRGFGRSTTPTGPYRLVDDVAAVLRALDATPAHVVGLSMGGGVALATALAHPDVVRSVVSIDGTCGGFRGTKDYLLPARVALTEGIEAAKAVWAADELFGPASRTPGLAERLRPQLEAYSGWHWTHPDPGRWFVSGAVDRLGEITVPTLAIVGALDHPDFLEVARVVEARVPGARRVVLDDVGHLPPYEAPAATVRALLDFLDAA